MAMSRSNRTKIKYDRRYADMKKVYIYDIGMCSEFHNFAGKRYDYAG